MKWYVSKMSGTLVLSNIFLLQLRAVETPGASCGLVFATSMEPAHTLDETLFVSLML